MSREIPKPYLIAKDEDGTFRLTVRGSRVRFTVRREALEMVLEDGAGFAVTVRGVPVEVSGTEPVVRVLAEAENAADAEKLCASIAALVERELG